MSSYDDDMKKKATRVPEDTLDCKELIDEEFKKKKTNWKASKTRISYFLDLATENSSSIFSFSSQSGNLVSLLSFLAVFDAFSSGSKDHHVIDITCYYYPAGKTGFIETIGN